MLRIRNEQMQTFNQIADNEFCLRVAARLRKDHPSYVREMDEKTLHKRVHIGLACARKYGFNIESNLSLFISLMFLVTPIFNEHERARLILEDEKTPVELRLPILANELSSLEWLEIRDSCSDIESAWLTLEKSYAKM